MSTDPNDPTDALETLRQVGKDEAERILKLLEAAVATSGRSRRRIERELGWSQGYLGSILRGRISLKVWHVFALSRELGIEPMSFFMTAAPPRDPGWILQQLGVDPPPKPPEPAVPKPERPPIDWDALEEMVRKLLLEELARFGLVPEPEPELDSEPAPF